MFYAKNEELEQVGCKLKQESQSYIYTERELGYGAMHSTNHLCAMDQILIF
jgi:hypothetical protein